LKNNEKFQSEFEKMLSKFLKISNRKNKEAQQNFKRKQGIKPQRRIVKEDQGD